MPILANNHQAVTSSSRPPAKSPFMKYHLSGKPPLPRRLKRVSRIFAVALGIGAVSVLLSHSAIAQNLVPKKEAITTQEPKSAEEFFNRGRAYADSGKHEFAIADFTRAIKLDSTYVSAYSNRGLVYAASGRTHLAVEDYAKAMALSADLILIDLMFGLIEYNSENYKKARAEFTKAIKLSNISLEYLLFTDKLDPVPFSAYFLRAATYIKLRKFDSAIADFTKAIEISPNFADAYSNRAFAYEELGMADKARADQETYKRLTGQ